MKIQSLVTFIHDFVNGPDFGKNFNRVSGIPAAILDFRCNTGQKFSWRFVAQPLLGKVTKPFQFIPNGSEMPLKRSVWG